MTRRRYSNRNRRRHGHKRRRSRRSPYYGGYSLWQYSSARSSAPGRREKSWSKDSDSIWSHEVASLIADFATMPAETLVAVMAGLLMIPGIVVSVLREMIAVFTGDLPMGLDIVVSAIPEALAAAAPSILAMFGMIALELAKAAMWIGVVMSAAGIVVLAVVSGIRVARR